MWTGVKCRTEHCRTRRATHQDPWYKQNVTARCVGGSADCTLDTCPSGAATAGISTEIIWQHTYIRSIKWGAIKTGVTDHNSSVGMKDCKVPIQTDLQSFDCYTIGHFDLSFTLHPRALQQPYFQQHIWSFNNKTNHYCCIYSNVSRSVGNTAIIHLTPTHSPPTNLCLSVQQEHTQ